MKISLPVIAIIAIVIVVAGAAVYLGTMPTTPSSTTTTTHTTTTTTTTPQVPVKAALVLDVPLSDPWAVMAYEGMLYIRDNLGVEIAYSELVGEADAERVVREYAAAGYDLVIGHSFGFQSALFAAAPDYPDTVFAWCDGYEITANVCAYAVLAHESGYLAGILAAGISQTGVIGAQGGMETPDVTRVIEGYRLGAKSVNPDIEVLTTYIGSWVDTGKSKEAALAMADAGADVLLHACSIAGLGAIEAGRERGAYIIGDTADQNPVAPDVIITSILARFGVPIIHMTEDIIAGTFESGYYTYSMVDGASDIAPYHELESVIPQEIKDLINETREEILAGTLVVPNIETPTE